MKGKNVSSELIFLKELNTTCTHLLCLSALSLPFTHSHQLVRSTLDTDMEDSVHRQNLET